MPPARCVYDMRTMQACYVACFLITKGCSIAKLLEAQGVALEPLHSNSPLDPAPHTLGASRLWVQVGCVRVAVGCYTCTAGCMHVPAASTE